MCGFWHLYFPKKLLRGKWVKYFIHIYIYVYMDTHIYTHDMCIYTHTHAYMYIYTCTYIHNISLSDFAESWTSRSPSVNDN